MLDPELSRLIPVLYPGVTVPPKPRNDLASIFLTGIMGLNKQKQRAAGGDDPTQHVDRPDAVRAAEPARSPRRAERRLPQRPPPDRRRDGHRAPGAGRGTPFTPAFNHSPNNVLTDGVDSNDKPFLTAFPYVPAPKSGYDSHK